MNRAAHLSCLSLILVVFLLVCTAWAQYGASLQGTVTDQSGAVVSGANVTATNEATGLSQRVVTSDSGSYRIPSLSPGTYAVEVESSSFKKSTTTGVVIEAEKVRGLNVTLQAGSAAETVSVIGEAGGVETETASVSGAISSRQVEQLPRATGFSGPPRPCRGSRSSRDAALPAMR